MNLDTFCNDVVPDFTPLGGNRPDCAVVMAAVISLLENIHQQQSVSLLLPPDVLDTAMAMVCATIIIRSASDTIVSPPDRKGSYRLSCRLEVVSAEASDKFCNKSFADTFEGNAMPWRYWNDRVFVQIALPDSITSCGDSFLCRCTSLVSIDLRNTKLHTVGSDFVSECHRLAEIHLPDSLSKVEGYFCYSCSSLVTIDLRNTKLNATGIHFISDCAKLTEVHLPDTLHTVGDPDKLHAVGDGFLYCCRSLVSIDLRNTKLHTIGSYFMYGCTTVKDIRLPCTLQSVGVSFLSRCSSLTSIDLRHTKLHTAERDFMSECGKLTSIHLPDTLHTVEGCFLQYCGLTEQEVVCIKRSIEARSK